jgi:hypothetical protein
MSSAEINTTKTNEWSTIRSINLYIEQQSDKLRPNITKLTRSTLQTFVDIPIDKIVKSCNIYVYFCKRANKAAILVKKNKYYRLILWDTETDKFTKGQWIKHCIIPSTELKVSHDGEYISYKMNRFEGDSWPTIYNVISMCPYFTAKRIECLSWGIDANRRGTKPKVTGWNGISIGQCGSCLLQTPSKVSLVTVDGGKIFRDGICILDVTRDEFENVKAPYDSV